MSQMYCLIAPSQRASIVQLEPFLLDIPAIAELDEQRRFNLIVATIEAATNAIIHGNRSDPGKSVEITVRVDDSTITVNVRDYGEGFDPSSVPDPRHTDNILREGGRGVFLIHALADKAEIIRSNPGTTVIITVNR